MDETDLSDIGTEVLPAPRREMQPTDLSDIGTPVPTAKAPDPFDLSDIGTPVETPAPVKARVSSRPSPTPTAFIPPVSSSWESNPPPPEPPDKSDIRGTEAPNARPLSFTETRRLAGKAVMGGLGDIANVMRPSTATAPNLTKANIAAPLEEPLPVEQAVQASAQEQKDRGEFPVATAMGATALSLAKAAPNFALLAVAPEGLIAQSIAAGGLFGIDDEGNFHPKEALIASLLPGVGLVGKTAVAAAIGKTLAKGGAAPINATAQKVLETIGEQVALDGYMTATQTPELLAQMKSDPQGAALHLAEIIGTNLGFSLLGIGRFSKKVPSKTRAWVERNADTLATRKVIESYSPEELRDIYTRVQRGDESATQSEKDLVQMINDQLGRQVGGGPGNIKEARTKGVNIVEQGWPEKLAQMLGIKGGRKRTVEVTPEGQATAVAQPSAVPTVQPEATRLLNQGPNANQEQAPVEVGGGQPPGPAAQVAEGSPSVVPQPARESGQGGQGTPPVVAPEATPEISPVTQAPTQPTVVPAPPKPLSNRQKALASMSDNPVFRADIKRTIESDPYVLSTEVGDEGQYTHAMKFSSGGKNYIARLRPEKHNAGGRAMFNHPAQLDVFLDDGKIVQQRLARINYSDVIPKAQITEISGAASIPPLPPNHTAVTIQRPDGSTYQAAFGGYWEQVPGVPPMISRVKDGAWSTASLYPGETIVSQVPPPPAQKPMPPAAADLSDIGKEVVSAPVTPNVEPSKEPWQMTKSDYQARFPRTDAGPQVETESELRETLRSESEALIKSGDLEAKKVKGGSNLKAKTQKGRDWIKAANARAFDRVNRAGMRAGIVKNEELTMAGEAQSHKLAVQQALSEGKDVPAEVLADYPDLKPKIEPTKPEPEAPTPAAEEPPTEGEKAALGDILKQAMASRTGKATGAQWKAELRNRPGVLKDEWALMRVDGLEDGKTYTKTDVLDYLKANEIQVKDVTLGQKKFAAQLRRFGSLTPDEQSQIPGHDWHKPEDWVGFVDGNYVGSAPGHYDETEALQNIDADRAEVEMGPVTTDTHFSQYTLPGAKEGSYREVLLTVPEVKTPQALPKGFTLEKVETADGRGLWIVRGQSGLNRGSGATEQDAIQSITGKPGWRDGHSQYAAIPNPIVRLRYNERAAADGKRMLFLEEVQPPQKGEFEKMPALFQKHWREIAMRWALRHAAENGFEAVGWTTGTQQAERYDLSKHVSAIRVENISGDGKKVDVSVRRVGHETEGNWYEIASGISADKLSDYIGKELGEKAAAAARDGREQQDFTGLDLRVGGAGLKKLYDQDLPNVVNNLAPVKKAGVKVGTQGISVGEREGEGMTDLKVEPGSFQGFWVVYGRTPDGVREQLSSQFSSRADAEKAMQQIGVPITTPVHAIAITPAMREPGAMASTPTEELTSPLRERQPVEARTVEELRTAINAKDAGLSPQVVRLANALLDLPVAKDFEGVRVVITDAVENGYAGSTLQNLIQFGRTADPKTLPHEFAHWLYQNVLPEDIRAEINRLKLASIEVLLKENEGNAELTAALTDLRDNPTVDTKDFLSRNYPKRYEKLLYHHSNDEEYFAHSFSDRFEQKAGSVVEGFWARVKAIWQQFLSALRKALRMRPRQNDVLDAVMAGRFDTTPESGNQFEHERLMASLGPSEEEPPSPYTETKVMGTDFGVLSRQTAAQIATMKDFSKTVLDSLKIPFTDTAVMDPETGKMEKEVYRFDASGEDQREQFEKLLERMKAEIRAQNEPGKANGLLMHLLNSVRLNYSNVPGSAMATLPTGLRDDLFAVAQGEISSVGAALSALSRLKPGLDVIGRNVDVYLHKEFSQAFNGDGIRKVIERALTHFRDLFTPKEIEDALNGHPDARTFINTLIRLSAQDQGGRLYRRLQRALAPKQPLTPEQLALKSKENEAYDKVLERLKAKYGIEPKPRPGKTKLTAMEELHLMLDPKTADAIGQSLEWALEEAQWNAGRVILKKYATSEKDPERKAALEDMLTEIDLAGPGNERVMPPQQFIDEGMKLPKYAHWEKIGEDLGYNPTTMRLVRQVLSEHFKGTKFEDPKVKPADTRIDLVKLAKSEDEEKARVMGAFMDNIEAVVDMSAASPETKLRVYNAIEQQMLAQLKKAQQRVVDNFFDPKANVPKTASERLRGLINAGVSRDPRFQTDRTRRLIRSVDSKYVSAKELESLATSTRAEKQQWIERKSEEIATAEKFNALDEPTRTYLEAVTWTYLAERLQAAEERITRSFLKGADRTFDVAPITPEARAKRLDEAKGKLEGIIRAGGIDTPMIDNVAAKGVVQRLVPNVSSLTKQVLETPFYRQDELAERFADHMVRDLSIDPAQVDKVKAMFQAAFKLPMTKALAAAGKQAIDALTPQERKQMRRRNVVEKLHRMFNAGGADPTTIIAEIAKANGYTPPSPAEIRIMRELSERAQRLAEPTPEEIKDAGGDVEKARRERMVTMEGKIGAANRELAARWARLTQPIKWSKFWATRQNIAAATNEFEIANLLLKTGFGFRLPLHMATQFLMHVPSRAAGFVAARVERGEESIGQAWGDLGRTMVQGFKETVDAIKPGLLAFRAGLLNRGETRNVERLMSGVQAFERMELKAKELDAQGKTAQAGALRFLGLVKWSLHFIRAMDAWQGTAVEMTEMSNLVDSSLIQKGFLLADRLVIRDRVFKGLPAKRDAALADARRIAAAAGETLTEAELVERASALVLSRMYDEIRMAHLPADEFQKRADLLKRLSAWQEPVKTGPGALVTVPLKYAQSMLRGAGLPGFFTQFSNAIGTGINWAFMNTPLYAMANMRPRGAEPSPYFTTEEDVWQRRFQALLGTAFGAIAVWAVFNNLMKYFGRPPMDRAERDLAEKAGHKWGTIEINLGDNHVYRLSTTVGVGTFLAPYAGGAQAAKDLIERRTQQQTAMNQEAEKKGLTPGKIPPPTTMERFQVAAESALALLMSGKTLTGAAQSFTEAGSFSPTKLAASYISPVVPGLPGWQEQMRAVGVHLDPRQATFMDFLVALPTSGHKAVNFMGDPVGTPDAVQNYVQTMLSGTYPLPVKAQLEEAPYVAVFESGYRPPSINPNKGYAIGNDFRPMTNQELQDYTVQRGVNFKQELQGLDGSDKVAVAKAFQRANQDALESVGVSVASIGGGGAPAASRAAVAPAVGGPGGASGTPRLATASRGTTLGGGLGGGLTRSRGARVGSRRGLSPRMVGRSLTTMRAGRGLSPRRGVRRSSRR